MVLSKVLFSRDGQGKENTKGRSLGDRPFFMSCPEKQKAGLYFGLLEILLGPLFKCRET